MISVAARRELAAAAISDPQLMASYLECRRLNAQHGRTYFLATWLLPPAKRPAVHALYGFARYADDIVDAFDGSPVTTRTARLEALATELVSPSATNPVLLALRDTQRRYAIDPLLLQEFLASMRMDLEVSDYATYDDLTRYMHGSAAVIGLQMLPVLGTVPGMRGVAEPYAHDLGVAFQLTNFIRDIGEDLRRGRIYLPKDELTAFEVTPDLLSSGVVDGRVRRLLAFQIARARELFRSAAPGIRLLDPTSRDCVTVALRLYGSILDAVAAADYQVLDRRVAVGPAARAKVAVPGLVRARRARRRS